MNKEKIKVIFIAGAGRSGSTLLGRLLGLPQGNVHVGEVGKIWEKITLNTEICGCGKPFDSCEFWQGVFDHGFGGVKSVDTNAMFQFKSKYERFHNLTFRRLTMLLNQRELREYCKNLQILYRSIQETTGARFVIDSTKSIHYLDTLTNLDNLDLRVLHLIRDSRAVAYSNQRLKRRRASISGDTYMPRASSLYSAMLWNMTNLVMQFPFQVPNSSILHLRYEDLIQHPEELLEKIEALSGERLDIYPLCAAETIQMNVQHTVDGNPDRFNSCIRIVLDSEWKEKMPSNQRRFVTALTYPLLRRYGYLNKGGEKPVALSH